MNISLSISIKKFHRSQTFSGEFHGDQQVLWDIMQTAFHQLPVWIPLAPLTSQVQAAHTWPSWPCADPRELCPVTCPSANNPACLLLPFPGTLGYWWIKCSQFYLHHSQGLWENATRTTHFILAVTFWTEYSNVLNWVLGGRLGLSGGAGKEVCTPPERFQRKQWQESFCLSSHTPAYLNKVSDKNAIPLPAALATPPSHCWCSSSSRGGFNSLWSCSL